MAHLLFEVILRLAKAGAATVVGVAVYGVAVGPLGAAPTVELAMVSWLVGAGFILLVESSPI